MAPAAPGWAGRLPDVPWDALAPYAAEARRHPGGIVDLSMGTPVDPTPELIRDALAAGSDAPGYPPTAGTPTLREAAAGWMRRRLGAEVDPAVILPTIGSKELVAWLPTFLGLGPGDTVAYPEIAYPTYAVGAILAGADGVPTDALTSLGPARVGMVWINSPSNPTGRVLPPAHLRKVVEWARERGTVVVSDECYLELGWEGESPVSMLHPDVCGGSYDGILAVHSLSKRSNLAGYRAGLVAGDASLIAGLLEVRKHGGMIVPAPVQAAMTVALGDDAHVEEQKQRYATRRAVLKPALEAAGFRVDFSEAGLYLWATRGSSDMQTVRELAALGILVVPGSFYGAAGAGHVRVALTASDERIAAAAARLTG